jgi:hypothetical protein
MAGNYLWSRNNSLTKLKSNGQIVILSARKEDSIPLTVNPKDAMDDFFNQMDISCLPTKGV